MSIDPKGDLRGKMVSIRTIAVFGLCSAAAAHAADGGTDSYPVKPIRFIIPFAPGGGADAMARVVAPRLAENLKQQVIVDNRAGAGGNIGAEIGARAAPDGYTIVMGSANLAVNMALYEKQSFDALRDFAPVTLLATTPNLVVIHPSLPAKSVKDLIALAHAAPGKINYSSGGSGSTPHLTAELFKTMAKVNIVHVPYKGTGPAVLALLGGEVSLTMVPALSVLPQIKAGRVRTLAITSARRAAAFPDLPTVAESVPGYEASQWYGVLVPAKTPDPIIAQLNSECVKIVQNPEFTARLTSEASIPGGTTPQQFGAYFKEEVTKWAKVVKFSGARVD
jgi:tripartite-type tricarboxylate transporter receptor subunit TctC